MPKPKSNKRLCPDGRTLLRDARENELKGVPPPAAGRCVVVGRPEGLGGGSVRAILLSDCDGNPTLITGTDWRLCFDDPKLAPWLPIGWRMQKYPTGMGLSNLEEWFRFVIEDATATMPLGSDYLFRVGTADESFSRGESRFGVPQCPTIRGIVQHAHKIVKHLHLTGAPAEPVNPLADRASYITHLEHILDFLRGALLPPPSPHDKRRSCYDRDHTWLRWKEEEGMKPAGIRDRWNRENPQDAIGKGDAGRDTVKKGLAAALKDKE